MYIVYIQQVCSVAMNEINTEGNKALESIPGHNSTSTLLYKPKFDYTILHNCRMLKLIMQKIWHLSYYLNLYMYVVIVKVDSTSEVDFALIQDPTFTTTYVETQHKVNSGSLGYVCSSVFYIPLSYYWQGEFYDIAHPKEAPFTPPSLPAITENGSMLYMWLTDYMANSAGYVYQTAGVLHYTITPSMVPPSVPFQLNTFSFKDIIPQVLTAIILSRVRCNCVHSYLHTHGYTTIYKGSCEVCIMRCHVHHTQLTVNCVPIRHCQTICHYINSVHIYIIVM